MNEKTSLRLPNSCSDNLKSKTCPEPCRRIQNRKLVGFIALVVALTMCWVRAEAQQPTKVPRIGFLDASSASGIAGLLAAFWQEMMPGVPVFSRYFTMSPFHMS